MNGSATQELYQLPLAPCCFRSGAVIVKAVAEVPELSAVTA
jgi:hypothetical protein